MPSCAPYKILPYRRTLQKNWDGIYYKACNENYNPINFMSNSIGSPSFNGFKEHSIKICEFIAVDTSKIYDAEYDIGEIKKSSISSKIPIFCTYFKLASIDTGYSLFKTLRETRRYGGQNWEKFAHTTKEIEICFSLVPSFAMLQECGFVFMIHNYSPVYHKDLDFRALFASLIIGSKCEEFEKDAMIVDCAIGTDKLSVIKSKEFDLERVLKKINNEFSQNINIFGRCTKPDFEDQSDLNGDLFLFPSLDDMASIIGEEDEEKSVADDFVDIVIDEPLTKISESFTTTNTTATHDSGASILFPGYNEKNEFPTSNKKKNRFIRFLC